MDEADDEVVEAFLKVLGSGYGAQHFTDALIRRYHATHTIESDELRHLEQVVAQVREDYHRHLEGL